MLFLQSISWTASTDELDLGKLIQSTGELLFASLHLEGKTSVVSHSNILCIKEFALELCTAYLLEMEI